MPSRFCTPRSESLFLSLSLSPCPLLPRTLFCVLTPPPPPHRYADAKMKMEECLNLNPGFDPAVQAMKQIEYLMSSAPAPAAPSAAPAAPAAAAAPPAPVAAAAKAKRRASIDSVQASVAGWYYVLCWRPRMLRLTSHSLSLSLSFLSSFIIPPSLPLVRVSRRSHAGD